MVQADALECINGVTDARLYNVNTGELTNVA
jgi:hypothetical protein